MANSQLPFSPPSSANCLNWDRYTYKSLSPSFFVLSSIQHSPRPNRRLSIIPSINRQHRPSISTCFDYDTSTTSNACSTFIPAREGLHRGQDDRRHTALSTDGLPLMSSTHQHQHRGQPSSVSLGSPLELTAPPTATRKCGQTHLLRWAFSMLHVKASRAPTCKPSCFTRNSYLKAFLTSWS